MLKLLKRTLRKWNDRLVSHDLLDEPHIVTGELEGRHQCLEEVLSGPGPFALLCRSDLIQEPEAQPAALLGVTAGGSAHQPDTELHGQFGWGVGFISWVGRAFVDDQAPVGPARHVAVTIGGPCSRAPLHGDDRRVLGLLSGRHDDLVVRRGHGGSRTERVVES